MKGSNKPSSLTESVSDFFTSLKYTVLLAIALSACGSDTSSHSSALIQVLTDIKKTDSTLNKQPTGSEDFRKALPLLHQYTKNLELMIHQMLQNMHRDTPDSVLEQSLNELKDYATFMSDFSDPTSKKTAIDLLLKYEQLTQNIQYLISGDTQLQNTFDIIRAKMLSNAAATYSENKASEYQQLDTAQQLLQQALEIRKKTNSDSTQLLINRSNVLLSMARNIDNIKNQYDHLISAYDKIKPLLDNKNLQASHRQMIINNLVNIGLLLQDLEKNNPSIQIPTDIATIDMLKTNYLDALLSGPHKDYPWYQKIIKHVESDKVDDDLLAKEVFNTLSFEDFGNIENARQITETIQSLYEKLKNTEKTSKYRKTKRIIQMISLFFKNNLDQAVLMLEREKKELANQSKKTSEKRSRDIIVLVGVILGILGLYIYTITRNHAKQQTTNQQLVKAIEETKRMYQEVLDTNQQLEEVNERLQKAQKETITKKHHLQEIAEGMAHIISSYVSKLRGLLSLVDLELLRTLGEESEKMYHTMNDLLQSFTIANKNILEYLTIAAGDSEILGEELLDYYIPDEMICLLEDCKTKYGLSYSIPKFERQNPLPLPCDKTWYDLCLNLIVSNSLSNCLGSKKPSINIDANVTGDYLCISISDNGVGFDPSFIGKDGYVIEPLANSKTPSPYKLKERGPKNPFKYTDNYGSNNGLGLTIVYEFMKWIKGSITIQSSPGKGSTVKLSFPLNTAKQ